MFIRMRVRSGSILLDKSGPSCVVCELEASLPLNSLHGLIGL